MSGAAASADEPSRPTLPVREGYDRWASVYDTDGNPLIALEERHIGRLIGDACGLDVADVGCGTGRHAIRLAAAGARVTALDFSAGMLARARAKGDAAAVRFLPHDVTRPLPLPEHAFDRVLCCLVAEHVADLDALVRDLARICRPCGSIIISAMHPALGLRGVQARFHDAAGHAQIESAAHQISDYVMAARRAGLVIGHLSEHAVDDALAATHPRAAKYLGWPLLLLMQAVPAGAVVESRRPA